MLVAIVQSKSFWHSVTRPFRGYGPVSSPTGCWRALMSVLKMVDRLFQVSLSGSDILGCSEHVMPCIYGEEQHPAMRAP